MMHAVLRQRRLVLGASLLLTLLTALAAPAAFAADDVGRITDDELAQALEMIDATETQFLALIAKVEGDAWTFKPAPDRWSVAECAEHIVRTEAALLGTAKQAIAAGADPEWQAKAEAKTQLLTGAIPNRTTRVQAPQEVRPAGGMDKAKVVEQFKINRVAVRTMLQDRAVPLKTYLADNPFFGALNAHQWLIYGALHTTRHMKQIEEVMATDGYPGK
jgi:hypothetical protein